jgi:hypothetical protein
MLPKGVDRDPGCSVAVARVVTCVPCVQPQYTVLSKEELRAQRQKALDSVTSVLGITDDEAARLLRKYKW